MKNYLLIFSVLACTISCISKKPIIELKPKPSYFLFERYKEESKEDQIAFMRSLAGIIDSTGSQGFDNVLIKRDVNGNIEDIIINESKQLNSPSAGFQLGSIQGANNSACQGAGGCIQMSDNWIDDVLTRMQNGNGLQSQLATDLIGFMNTNQLTLTTSGVDRVTRELNIVRINNFN